MSELPPSPLPPAPIHLAPLPLEPEARTTARAPVGGFAPGPVPVLAAARPVAWSTAAVGLPASVRAVIALGITVGCLSIIACLASGGLAVGLIAASQAGAARIRQFAPAALPVSAPGQPVMLAVPLSAPGRGPRGSAPDRRLALLAVLRRMAAMSAAQELQLDALLREAGDDLFPPGAALDDAAVEASVKEYGAMPAARSGAATVYFVTASGRAEVYEDHAVLYAGSSTVRASAGRPLNSSGHPILVQADVDALLGLIGQASNGSLTAGQTEALSQMLHSSDQQLVAITGPADAPSIGISGVSVRQEGYLLVVFAGGPVMLSPSGHVLLNSDPLPGANLAACALVIVEALLGIALAIWLLLLSSRLAKQRLMSPRSHRRWALLKIALSAVGAVAFGGMIASFFGSTPHWQSISQLAGYGSAGAVLAAGIAFPLAALVLLSRRNARLYFDGVI